MATTLAQIAQLVDGTLIGDPSLEIAAAATLDMASARDISLFDRPKFNRHFTASAARAFVVSHEFEQDEAHHDISIIRVDNVHAAFGKIVEHFRPVREKKRRGIHAHAVVNATATLADDVDIHALATIGEEVEIGARTTIHQGARVAAGCRIGSDVTIYPNAVLYENTIVGDRSIIHASAVLGAYGFGYNSTTGEHVLSAQLGYVEVGDDVEIGAGTTIDRGTYGPTTIGTGTKIDNLVMIAHNCQIGRHNMLCAQVGIAGSTTTGDYVVMAGQVGVRDHVNIGQRAVLGAKCGVTNDVKAGESVLGAPAIPERTQKLRVGAMARLPEMRKELKKLRNAVAELQAEKEVSPKQTVSRDSHAA